MKNHSRHGCNESIEQNNNKTTAFGMMNRRKIRSSTVICYQSHRYR